MGHAIAVGICNETKLLFVGIAPLVVNICAFVNHSVRHCKTFSCVMHGNQDDQQSTLIHL